MSIQNSIEKPDMRRIRTLSWEFLLALCIVFIMSGGVSRLYSEESTDQLLSLREMGAKDVIVTRKSEGNIYRGIVLLFVYSFISLYFIRRWKSFIPVFKRGLPVLAVALLSVASTYWSLDPKATFIRSGSFLFGTMTGFYLAVRYSPPELCNVFGRCFLWLCVFELCTVIIDPQYAIHKGVHFPAFRGFFPHKNVMGNTMVIGFLFSLFLMDSKNKILGRWLLFLSLVIIALSLSRTAWIMTVFVIVTYLALKMMRSFRYMGVMLVSIFVFSCASIIYIVHDEQELAASVVTALGRDITLTGRTEIWLRILDVMRHGPLWLGFGYQSFWTSPNGAQSYFLNYLGFVPAHAHNGWLQIMTHLGLVGTLLITIAFFYGVWRNFLLAAFVSDIRYSLGLAFLLLVAAINIPECYLIVPERLYWQLFIFFVANRHGDKLLKPNVRFLRKTKSFSPPNFKKNISQRFLRC